MKDLFFLCSLLTAEVNVMNQVKNSVQDSGWSIHIYGGRRLLVSLYPSHAWVFFLGALLSTLLIFAGLRLSTCVAQPSQQTATEKAQT